MIHQKLKICKGCGTPQPIFSNGRCLKCTPKKPLSKGSSPKKDKTHIDEFFLDRLIDLNKTKRSEESGNRIAYPTRANIAHLFNKRNHPSVSDHPSNYVFLTWEEHAILDNNCLDVNDFNELKKRFPNSFDLIINRMLEVLPNVVEKTKFVDAFKKFNKF